MFAALSFAMWDSFENSGPDSSVEMQELAATELVDYANSISDAVMKMRALGCEDEQLSFERSPFDGSDTDYVNGLAPSDFSCHLYHPKGGGIKEREFSSDLYDPVVKSALLALPSELSVFTAYNRINDVGTSTAELMYLHSGLKQGICESINDQLGLGFTIPVDSADIGTGAEFAGTYGAGNTSFANLGEGTIFEGATQGCIQESSGCVSANCYHYFRVLVIK